MLTIRSTVPKFSEKVLELGVAALVEDWDLIPSTHMVAHNHPLL